MKLYSLKEDVDCLISNGDPQTRCLLSRDDCRLFIQDEFPEQKKIRFELNNRAKLTNCVSQDGIASSGFVIDKKVKGIFDSHNLIKHKYYSVEVIGEDNRLISNDYFWVQFRQNLTNNIDYDTSTFYEVKIASRVGEVKLTSFEDYEKQRLEKGWKWDIEAKKIILKENLEITKLDLIQLFPFDRTICISERLRSSLLDSNISGFEINFYERVQF